MSSRNAKAMIVNSQKGSVSPMRATKSKSDQNEQSRSRSQSKNKLSIMNSDTSKASTLASTRVNNLVAKAIKAMAKKSTKNNRSNSLSSNSAESDDMSRSSSPVQRETTKNMNRKSMGTKNSSNQIQETPKKKTTSNSATKKNPKKQTGNKKEKTETKTVQEEPMTMMTEASQPKKNNTKKSKEIFNGSMEDAIKDCINNLKSKATYDSIKTSLKSDYSVTVNEMEMQKTFSKMECEGSISVNSSGVYNVTRDVEMICSTMSPTSKMMISKIAKEIEEENWRKKVIVIEETPIKVKIESHSEQSSFTKASENNSPDSHQKQGKKNSKNKNSKDMTTKQTHVDDQMLSTLKSLFPTSFNLTPAFSTMMRMFNTECSTQINEYEVKVFNMLSHMMEMRNCMMNSEMMSMCSKAMQMNESTSSEMFNMVTMMCASDMKMMSQMMTSMMPSTNDEQQYTEEMMCARYSNLMKMKCFMNLMNTVECGFNDSSMSLMGEMDYKMMMIGCMMARCGTELSSTVMSNMFQTMMEENLSCKNMKSMKSMMNMMMPPTQMNLMKQDFMNKFFKCTTEVYNTFKSKLTDRENMMMCEIMSRMTSMTSESFMKMVSETNLTCMMIHLFNMQNQDLMHQMVDMVKNMVTFSSTFSGSKFQSNSAKYTPMKVESVNGETFAQMFRMVNPHFSRMMTECFNCVMMMISENNHMENHKCHMNMSMVDFLTCMLSLHNSDSSPENFPSCFSMMFNFMKMNESQMKNFINSNFKCTESDDSHFTSDQLNMMNMCYMTEQFNDQMMSECFSKVCSNDVNMEMCKQMMSCLMKNRCLGNMSNSSSSSFNFDCTQNSLMNMMMCMNFEDKLCMMEMFCSMMTKQSMETTEKRMMDNMEMSMKGMMLNPFFSQMSCSVSQVPASEGESSKMSMNMMKCQMLSCKEKMQVLMNEISEKSQCMFLQSMASCPMFASCMKSCKSNNQMEQMLMMMSNFNFGTVLKYDRDMILTLQKLVENEIKVTNFMNMMMMDEEKQTSSVEKLTSSPCLKESSEKQMIVEVADILMGDVVVSSTPEEQKSSMVKETGSSSVVKCPTPKPESKPCSSSKSMMEAEEN